MTGKVYVVIYELASYEGPYSEILGVYATKALAEHARDACRHERGPKNARWDAEREKWVWGDLTPLGAGDAWSVCVEEFDVREKA